MKMHNDIERVLISAEELEAKISELANKISSDYNGKSILLIGLLKGSIVFLVDLMRKLTLPVEIDFMDVSSYGSGSKSSGVVRILKDLENPIEGRHVLLVEDIVDSGLTLNYVRGLLEARKPASLRVCAILNKYECRKTKVEAEYTGFDVPDEFLVGYGLDYNQKYRNLAYIGVLKRAVYEKN